MAGRVGQLVQPVQLGLAGERLVGAAADSVEAVATQEPVRVQVEADQVQEFTAQVAEEQEVVPQAAVDVFDDGTGPDRVVGESGDGGSERVESFGAKQITVDRAFDGQRSHESCRPQAHRETSSFPTDHTESFPGDALPVANDRSDVSCWSWPMFRR